MFTLSVALDEVEAVHMTDEQKCRWEQHDSVILRFATGWKRAQLYIFDWGIFFLWNFMDGYGMGSGAESRMG